MDINNTVPDPVERYTHELNRLDDECRSYFLKLPVWHQNLLINMPFSCFNVGDVFICPNKRISSINKNINILLNGEPSPNPYLDQRAMIDVWESGKHVRESPKDLMKIWDIVDMVFPLKGYHDERKRLIKELSYFLSNDDEYIAYDDDLFYTFEYESEHEEDLIALEGKCQIKLSELKTAAMCWRIGKYSSIAVMVWEKYLLEYMQKVNKTIETLFEYQSFNEEIDAINEKLRDLSSIKEKRMIVMLEILADNPSISRKDAWVICSRDFRSIFNIVESSFNKLWSKARAEFFKV